jgi:hypothetical protein
MATATPPVTKETMPAPIVAPVRSASEAPRAIVWDKCLPLTTMPTGIIASHSAAPSRNPRVKTFEIVVAPRSEYLEDDPLLARRVLRKVLASPIKVTPRAVDGPPAWRFIGVSRYDGVLAGGLTKGEVVRVQVDPALISILDDTYEPLAAHPLGFGPHPISGGSDATLPAWEPAVCDSSRPPM